MRILFLTRLFWPHLGGVEKHVEGLSLSLRKKKHRVTILTEKFDKNLKETEFVNGVKIVRFSYPKIKYLGILYIWFWFFKNRKLIEKSDIVHCHDVFIWYLPFRFLFPRKPVYITFHGWEGVYPIPWKSILLKRVAVILSKGNICVGKYLKKYFGIKSTSVTFGAVDTALSSKAVKDKSLTVYVGRLEKDTGLMVFLKRLKKIGEAKVVFCGDGSLRKECENYGEVLGFVDPRPYLAKASVCFPSGYLSALEAMVNKCEIELAWDNPLKKDYWTMTPFYEWIQNKDRSSAYNWVIGETWEKLADSYLKLWSR